MKKSALISASIVLGLASWAGSAAAACPTAQATLVIDQSGSMLSDGSTGDPKWEIALEKALIDFNSLADGTHVAVVGFGNTSSSPTPYVDEVVPLSAGLLKGSDDADLIMAIEATVQPDTSYLTPLSGGACDSLEDTFLYVDPVTSVDCTLTTARSVYLYSDGLENSTPSSHACHSDISSVGTFDRTLEDNGFGLDDNSWQWKLANMAWTGNPALESLPPGVPDSIRPVMNVTLLFDFINSLSSGAGADGAPAGANLQALDANAIALFSGLAEVTYGTYFEAKTVGGQPTVLPHPGDTDPQPLYSCVEAADVNRVLDAYGRDVSDSDPLFSAQDLAERDVNNDLTINIQDYYLVLSNYGLCS